MGYTFKGYSLVYLSPLFSILATLLYFLGSWSGWSNWFLPIVVFSLLQVFLICLQLLGLAFCSVGFKKKEPVPLSMSMSIFLSFLLALWGLFTIKLALGFYQDLLWWSNEPGVRSLTIWDHFQYEAWGFKGLLWILAGIILPIVAFYQKRQLMAKKPQNTVNQTHSSESKDWHN